MTPHEYGLRGYQVHTLEDRQAIVLQAHQLRAEAVSQFFAWLLGRSQVKAQGAQPFAPVGSARCS